MPRHRWPLIVVIIVAALVSAVFLLPGPHPNPRAWMFQRTGEEALLSQLRGMLQWALGWTRPLPATAPDVPVAYTDLPPFGVNTFLELEVEPEKRERSLQMITDAGFRWIRQPFGWYDIEIHGKGDFEDRRNEPYRSAWDKYDQIVDLAETYDVQIIARLGAPPAWSRAVGHDQGAFGPPDNLADFADYAEAIVSRYRGRIRFYQVWNEPNVYPEWGDQPVDPEGYAELLCMAYDRIKRTDPDAVVISGAMAQTMELGTPSGAYPGNNLMGTIFLQRMYDAGAGACFDIMAVNDYMLRSGPTDHRMTQREINFSRPMWLRDVMVANGDANKPIWISEMNSNAAPEPIPDRYGRVTLEQQARYAPLAFERIQRTWPWAGVTTVWFFKRPSDQEIDQPMYYFRLVEPDFTPMPVYESLASYITTLAPTLYRGNHATSTWQLAYHGAWEDVNDPNAVLGHYRRALEPGASVTFAWEGRRLILTPGPGTGVVRLIDEQGTTRDLNLNGAPLTLSRSWRSQRRRLTLTVVEGEVTLDQLQVR